jgi:hypothetical protein
MRSGTTGTIHAEAREDMVERDATPSACNVRRLPSPWSQVFFMVALPELMAMKPVWYEATS